MKYLSVCSGIEAATVAWQPLGSHPVAFSEIEPFPCAVLAEHYPDVPNLGDMTQYKEWDIEQPDILVGGTPCQSFSVAGLRGGLADPRGNLMLIFGAIARAVQPTWIVWENVPGVLSSNGGRDFGTFLGMLAELGYGFAYRVLDAQYVRVESHARAVPQRRRRVFVVGYLGDVGRSTDAPTFQDQARFSLVSAQVLFESESLQGYPPPSRETGARVADPITESFAKHGGASAGKDSYPRNVVTQALTQRLRSGGPDDNKAQGGFYVADVGHAPDACKTSSGRLDPNGMDLISFDTTQITHPENRSNPRPGDPSPTIPKDGHVPAVAGTLREHPRPGSNSNGATTGVRRLTPRECERLQGFPDDYTLVTYRGKPAADGPRYRALGNSMAVNVMRWIGERIKGGMVFDG